MRLTEHFTLEELTVTQVRDVDNDPDPQELDNLRALAGALEGVRRALDHLPILISSGYRSPEVNRRVGGSQSSAHMQGLAADFICPSFGTPYECCVAIEDLVRDFDQLIHEYGRWVHFAIAAPGTQGRRQRLTIFTAAEGYLPGIRKRGVI